MSVEASPIITTSAPASPAPAANASGQPGRAGPHVVADDHGGGAGDLGVRPAGRAGQPLVDLLRRQPAHVVGLEDGAHDVRVAGAAHGRDPSSFQELGASSWVSTRR